MIRSELKHKQMVLSCFKMLTCPVLINGLTALHARKDFASKKLQQVQPGKLDAVFFDYESLNCLQINKKRKCQACANANCI